VIKSVLVIVGAGLFASIFAILSIDGPSGLLCVVWRLLGQPCYRLDEYEREQQIKRLQDWLNSELKR
jgi:hypothetical protein